MTSEFFAAADPEGSFDGKSILFAGQKRQSEPWQIWETSADGTRVRQITHCGGDCLGPALLSETQIAYTMVTGVGDQRTSKVYLCNLGGDSAHPITFGPGNYELEAVLHNGRLPLSAKWPLTEDSASAVERTLFTIRPDGSGLTLVQDTLAQEVSVVGGRELANGALLFVESRLGGGLYDRRAACAAPPKHPARFDPSNACRSRCIRSGECRETVCSSPVAVAQPTAVASTFTA